MDREIRKMVRLAKRQARIREQIYNMAGKRLQGEDVSIDGLYDVDEDISDECGSNNGFERLLADLQRECFDIALSARLIAYKTEKAGTATQPEGPIIHWYNEALLAGLQPERIHQQFAGFHGGRIPPLGEGTKVEFRKFEPLPAFCEQITEQAQGDEITAEDIIEAARAMLEAPVEPVVGQGHIFGFSLSKKAYDEIVEEGAEVGLNLKGDNDGLIGTMKGVPFIVDEQQEEPYKHIVWPPVPPLGWKASCVGPITPETDYRVIIQKPDGTDPLDNEGKITFIPGSAAPKDEVSS